jgi:hypothetical protein
MVTRGWSDPRLPVALVLGTLAAVVYAVGSSGAGYMSDMAQVWHGARAVLEGLDPYDPAVATWEEAWGFRFLYPLPALVVAMPLALLPLRVAEIGFVGLSTALLAFGLLARGPHRLLILLSGPYLGALASAQWSPIMAAALLVPALAPLCIVKPNIALAFLVTARTRRFVIHAVVGGAVLTAISFAIDPAWVGKWLSRLGETPHIRPPILLPGGFVLLLALLRWRRWEARLLLALACIPHTTLVYEALPLLLVATGLRQVAAMVSLSFVALVAQFWLDTRVPGGEDLALEAFASWTHSVGLVMLGLIYLPALLLVLGRPASPDPPEPPPRPR